MSKNFVLNSVGLSIKRLTINLQNSIFELMVICHMQFEEKVISESLSIFSSQLKPRCYLL